METSYPKKAGIYKLTNICNGKFYIGKTFSIKQRINDHKTSKNKVSNKTFIKNAISKYGWESFKIEILEIFENFDKLNDNISLLEREAFYINFYDSANKDKGYNICKFSTDRTGIPLSNEAKIKLSIFNRGKKLSDETKEKIRQSKVGGKFSDEHRKKLSEAKRRNPMSEEHKEKLRLSNIGKKLSDETKEKIRVKLSGRTISEETKDKFRKPCSEEAKEKIRIGNLGRKHKPESIEKMRLAKLGKKKRKNI
jgi:group I intron endonuclease